MLPTAWTSEAERTFARLCHDRSMGRDYERLCVATEACVCAAMTGLMVSRSACALEQRVNPSPYLTGVAFTLLSCISDKKQ